MTEKQYTIGDYTNCRYDISEILKDDEVYCIVGTEYIDKIIKVLEENEQLKSELAIYRKLASCSNCKYHDYDWYDDGDEFEVCIKGNDVTEGICKEWEEF